MSTSEAIATGAQQTATQRAQALLAQMTLAEKIGQMTQLAIDAVAVESAVTTGALTETDIAGLVFMREEEKLARDVYLTMSDRWGAPVFENIAASEGAVVFENELMQLVQYKPLTETVQRRPLLIIPPWINKFYILDLKPRNSFIRFAVAQGLTGVLVLEHPLFLGHREVEVAEGEGLEVGELVVG